jgi:hypothetical protein
LLDLSLGYAFATHQLRLLDEREDDHQIEGSLDLMLAGPWRAHLSAHALIGDLPLQLTLVSSVSWRF